MWVSSANDHIYNLSVNDLITFAVRKFKMRTYFTDYRDLNLLLKVFCKMDNDPSEEFEEYNHRCETSAKKERLKEKLNLFLDCNLFHFYFPFLFLNSISKPWHQSVHLWTRSWNLWRPKIKISSYLVAVRAVSNGDIWHKIFVVLESKGLRPSADDYFVWLQRFKSSSTKHHRLEVRSTLLDDKTWW